jgi:4-coumarate--CoA ligase
MPFPSIYPLLDIPESNVLSYLFPRGEEPYDEPIWFDSKNDKNNLTPKQLLRWVGRLSFGLERLGLKRDDVVMIYTPNHIFVPVAYLGIVGAGCVFSGANPSYTIPGQCSLSYMPHPNPPDLHQIRARASDHEYNNKDDTRSSE